MGRVDEIRARVEALEELNDEPGPSTATDDRWAGLDDIREADAVEEWAQRTAAQHGFSQAEHVVDIFGVCADCARARARERGDD